MAFTTQDVNDEVRFLLGGLSTSTMDDTTLNKLIDNNISKYSTEDSDFCIVTYKSLLDALRYLIRQEDLQSGSSSSVVKRREKNNRREIEVQYSESSSSGYKTLLDDFLKHPEWVCEDLVDRLVPSGSVHIGGVSESEYDKVNNDKDSRNGYKTSVRKRYDQSTTESVRLRKNTWPW
jgi:hypothetical protein